MVALKFKKLREDAILPSYATAGAAGMDVHACLGSAVDVWPNDRGIFSTGLAVEIPKDFELQVRPRSGLAAKYGLMVVNSPGTIDSDYRGEIKVILLNSGSEVMCISPGDRIAQLVLAPVTRAQVMELVGELSDTARGDGGFGSTGA